MGDGLSITLEVYLPFRGRRLGWSGRETVPAGVTAGALPGLLGLTEPELVVLVNGRSVPETTPLRDGDDVAVLRQAEGGA
jgi:sulfur carrier protein ThiS